MQIKKQYENLVVYFDVLGPTIELKDSEVLTNIIESLSGFKFILREQPFNDLIKQQQKNPRHILVSFQPKPLDEYKFIIKAIYNFLLGTDQIVNFSIDRIEINHNDDTLIIFGVEILREFLDDKTGFAPIIRADWKNSSVVEKILKLR